MTGRRCTGRQTPRGHVGVAERQLASLTRVYLLRKVSVTLWQYILTRVRE